MLAILDGILMDAAQAWIPVTDEGLLRGDGVFEVVRLYEGRPFALDEHLDRMGRSAAAIRLPIDLDALRSDVAAILAEAEPADGALRLPDTIALATITYAPSRILNGVKSLSYAANMLASRLAREAGADEALLVTPHGRVLEAPTTSFVYVLAGRLYTPPLADGILDSITRRILFAVTDVEERATTLDDLRTLVEAFLASSIREVHPVRAIDGTPIDGTPGPITAEVAERVREHIAAELARQP
jgi:branched-chain amino acid aminotransferase